MFDVLELNSIHDKNLFFIKWRLTHECNLACSYCAHKIFRLPYKKNDAEQIHLCEIAGQISKLIDKVKQDKVKIDLVGGEVTLFELEDILRNLTTKKLFRIQITTNFMRDKDYYISLADYLKSRDIELSLTASFHCEFTDMDKYFEKVKAIKDKCTIFCSEMVSTADSQNLVHDFEKKCKELDIDYLIDADTRREANVLRMNKKLYTSNRRKNKSHRYTAVLQDEKLKIYNKTYLTRNDFLLDDNIKQISRAKLFNTKGYYCSMGWNYIYIEVDKIGTKTRNNPDCTIRIPIKEFEQIKPTKCIANFCTLCGNMNISKNKTF
ncbi:MAG: hypothetical protein IJL70_07365 [Treponema sp.]|nr:hypothetical protein [Treponema sp.]